MSRVINELDSIHFSIKKASQLVKEIGRQVSTSQSSLFLLSTLFLFITISVKQVATDRCIMAMLFLIVAGVIAVIIVKVSTKLVWRFAYLTITVILFRVFFILLAV
jgi:novel plant SNARE